ncbi:MAG TPA: hypothetical protein VMK12_11695, partial [Anaeromyxobacteraceae bacterium]|nr:hypothetical protein [Anaeromyxobacteraceae bacterium]
GSSQRLEAGVTDASERPANVGASKLKWVTSDSTVVALTVDADHHGATATAVAPGQAQVSAACEGITAVAAIKVKGVQSTPPVSSPIATGEHSCAVVSGGARCWGNDELGQLGSAATQTCNGIPCSSVPVAVGGLSSGVTAIAVGREHTCVIANGGAQCFGANLFGELGDARIDSGGAAPVPVAGLSSGVTAIAAGDYHNCAIVNGGVQCWGQNLLGQLGTSLYTMSAAPVAVPGLMDVVAIAAGGEHTCAIANGAVTCWGLDANGELGSPTTEVCGGAPCSTVPLPVAGLSSGVTAVAAGVASTCAIVNGGVQCWGSNAHGELGDNAAGDSAEPVPVAGLSSGAMAIAAGIDHACAIVNGAVRCWGNDAHGELGDNGTSDSAVPVQVMGLSSGATAIAAGDYSTCALANGGIECWGANLFGQLGDASTDGSAVPRPVLLH